MKASDHCRYTVKALVHASRVLELVVAKAREAGLRLVAIGDEATRSAGAAAGLALPSKDLLIAKDCPWPGIASQADGGELAGPTANPWIRSNGWFLRLAKVQSPQKTVWLMFEPPGAPNIVLLETYLRAVADTGAWGGRWVVSLDSGLRSGLVRGDAKALAS